jgi:phosphoglycolate phosphatase-like HAD superfamily hydrolase
MSDVRGGWIFLDLDGPLLDVLPRYHRLHADVVRWRHGRPLDAAEYWQAKRQRVSETRILERTGLDAPAIRQAAARRLRWIESPRYLSLDRTWPWTQESLEALSCFGPLVLVTLRRRRDRLLWQLRHLGLRDRFHRIVSGPGDASVEAKAPLLRSAGVPIPPGSVLVGDTEVDVASAKALGLGTVALSCGIRCADALAAWQPDVLVDDLRQVAGYLLSLGWQRRVPDARPPDPGTAP